MKTVVSQSNQSPLDIALIACGTLEGAMQLMAHNEASITADVTPGTTYTIPNDVTTDDYSLQYLQQSKIVIGTKG